MGSRSARPEASPPGLPETVLVGEVQRPHGLRGEVRVAVHSDLPERFAPGSELLASRRGAPPRQLTIESCRATRGAVLVRFAGYADRDAAETLRGARLEVERSRVPAAPDGCWYFFELAGCRVFDAAAGELGEVVDLWDDGGAVVLQVRQEGREGGREVLVPFVGAFLREVDVIARRIDMELPPGLVDACGSGS